jgi:tRNA modification GTPase
MTRYLDLVADTICAPITAPGRAGVSVIRVSGSRSLSILRSISDLRDALESHRVYLSYIYDGSESVDQVLVTYFESGRSFTGDEVLEISTHGNPLITNRIVNLLLSHGCRMAEPGEFSFRAFYNNKIDLIQAESINDLIMAQNTRKAASSLAKLKGNISSRLTQVEQSLISVMAELEASIDFSEEDIPLENSSHLVDQLRPSFEILVQLMDSYNVGRSLDKGAKILLLGSTNVGKSSLFNYFCKEDLAIVTDVPGTTRDLIRGQQFIGPHPVEFIDSAGLRVSDDQVESIGISLSRGMLPSADIVLFVFDSTQEIPVSELAHLPWEKTFLVFNKFDLIGEDTEYFLKQVGDYFPDSSKPLIHLVSAQTGFGVSSLISHVESHLSNLMAQDTGAEITQARHYNHLCVCHDHMTQAKALLNESESPDLVSQELMLALVEIQSILGKQFDDEILDKIFSQFCIGK